VLGQLVLPVSAAGDTHVYSRVFKLFSIWQFRPHIFY